jgi:hypothetical protein
MLRSNIFLPVLFSALVYLCPAARAAEAPIPECTKEDVRRILLAQDWTNVNVIAVVNGLTRDKVAAPSLCHVLAIARRDNRWQDLKIDLYYDRDLGWFTYESGAELFRIWTRNGYREIKPSLGF